MGLLHLLAAIFQFFLLSSGYASRSEGFGSAGSIRRENSEKTHVAHYGIQSSGRMSIQVSREC